VTEQDPPARADGPRPEARKGDAAEPPVLAELVAGGEAACYAHLVCLECGAVVSEGHLPGCASAPGE
jgi:hypothetical protein